jgi:hypothetical protein
MRLGGLQSRSGRCEEEKNLTPLQGIEPRPSSLYDVLYADWATPTQFFSFEDTNKIFEPPSKNTFLYYSSRIIHPMALILFAFDKV